MKNLARLDESTEALLLVSRVLSETEGTVVVTSCEDGAGKSTFCQVLAKLAVERHDRQVVYVDLNLRHPLVDGGLLADHLGERFEFRQPGADYAQLPGWAKRERIAKLLERPAGGALVIVDTSPLGVFNKHNVHPIHLAEWTRDFVLVVSQDSTRNSAIREAKALLDTHGIRLVGAVLNQHGGDEVRDSASVTGWRGMYRAAMRLVRRWPELRDRLRGTFHGARVLWRLVRPSVRRGMGLLQSWGPFAWALAWLRRVRPQLVGRLRGGLSRWRGRIDRWLQKGDRRWTRS